MAGDYLPNDLKRLWKELNTSPLQLSSEQLRWEMEELQKGLRKRSVLGTGASLFVIIAFTVSLFLFSNALQRVGSILTVLGTGYLLVQLKMRQARARPDLGAMDCISFYRAELMHQRDFHQGKWFWSRLLMFLPGPIIWFVGFAQSRPGLRPFIWLELAVFLIFAAIAVPLNLRLARKYQHRIDALDTSFKTNG